MGKISNKKIVGIVAKFLGKSELVKKDGKYELTDDERQRISATYGKDFLEAFEASADDEDAVSIFNAMLKSSQQKDQTIAGLQSDKQQLQQTVATLSEEAEPKPAPKAATPAAGAAARYSVNAAAFHNKLAAQALASSQGFANALVAASNVTISASDLSELNAEFGTSMPANTRIEVLNKRIYNAFNDAKFLTKVQSITDYKAAAAIITEVSQQFTAKWTPKGNAKFTPVTIPYRRHKINVPIIPAEVLSSWLVYLYEQGKTQADMPFTKYLIEEHILPKVPEDITFAMLGKGKFVDHTSEATDGGAGFAAKDSMDGYETILVEGLTDADCKFNYFKGAKDFRTLDDAALIKYVEDFVDAISPFFAKNMELHCSPEFLTRYKRAEYAVYGNKTNTESDGSIRFTKFTLIPLESMYSSPILFATPRANFVMLVDLQKAENCISEIQKVGYEVRVMGEYSLSVGFRIQEAVYAAVPADYDPSGSIATDPASYSDNWANGGDQSLVSSGASAGTDEGE